MKITCQCEWHSLIMRKLLTSIRERKMLFWNQPKHNKTLSAVSEKQVGWTVTDTDGKEEKESPEQCFFVCSLLVVYLYKRAKRVQHSLSCLQCVNLDEPKHHSSHVCCKDGLQHPTYRVMKFQVQTDWKGSLGGKLTGEAEGRMLVFWKKHI